MKLRRAAKRLAAAGRPAATAPATTTDVPCVPCGKQAGIRAFSLNEIDIDAVADDLALVHAPATQFVVLGGEVVLFDPLRSTGTLLNATAALIWASIDDGTTVSQLIDLLVAETQGDRAVIDRDVRDTVARFIAGGILEPTPAAGADGPGPDGPPTPNPSTTSSSTSNPTPTAVATAPPSDADRRRSARRIAALDRMTWFGDGEVRACSGARVLVRANTPELAAALAPALALLPTAVDTATTTLSVVERNRGSRIEVHVGADQGAPSTTVAGAVAVALSALDDLAAAGSRDQIVLHAGAVERDGRVAVIVGPSGAGKSTLTAHLVRHGFGYLTDEVAAIDPRTWAVTPYPKALGLHDDALVLLDLAGLRTDDPGKSRVAPAELGRVATGGRLSLVVLLHDETADPARPDSPATDLLELLSSSFAATFDPATSVAHPLDALATLVETVPVLRLARGTLDDAERAVAEALSPPT